MFYMTWSCDVQQEKNLFDVNFKQKNAVFEVGSLFIAII